MPRLKNGPCKNCCCNDCGIRPRGDAKECCYCACDELCVVMTVERTGSYSDPCDDSCGCIPDGACTCVVARAILSWDPDNCYWEGEIACGQAIVDLRVEIKKCRGVCKVCVTSVCLGLDGDCSENGCFDLTDCGEYGDGCNAADVTLVTLSNMALGGCGDTNCGTAEIVIRCQSILNPQPTPPLCRNCDCVCECICLTYSEGGCSETKLACWDAGVNGWQATFDGDCPFDAQTITITMVADSSGCCRWHLEASRGTVDGTDPPTNCPRPIEVWTLDNIAASVEMECSICDECEVDGGCCPQDLPYTIYARICGPCGSYCVPLNFAGSTATTGVWRSGPVTIQCTDGLDFTCKDIAIDAIEFECLESGTLWQIVLWCSGTAVHTAVPPIQCDPFCAGDIFVLDDVLCTWAGVTCVDGWDICISERPC